MKSIVRALLLLLLIPVASSAQWRQTAGPSGGAAHAFAVSGNAVYAATTAGLFKSTDVGNTWQRLGSGLPVVRMTAVHVDGDRIVVGSANLVNGGIFLSEDGGATFRKVLSYISGSIHKVGSNYFANAGFSGIVRSTDNGATWAQTSTSLPGGTSVFDFIRVGNRIVAVTYGAGAVRSTDEGRTWTAMSVGDRSAITDVIEVSGMLIGGTINGLLSSNDGGYTWRAYGRGLPVQQIVRTLEQRGTEIFAGTDSAVYRSTDEGENWEMVGGKIVTHGAVNDLAVLNGRLLVATNRCIYGLDAEMVGWMESSTGIPGTLVNRLHAADGALFALSNMSTDGGGSWTSLADAIPGIDYVSGAASTPRGILIGTNVGLYLRSSTGAWTHVDDPRFGTDSLRAMVSYDGVVIAAFVSGIFRSDDGGASWRPTTGVAGMPGYVLPTSMTVDDAHVYLSVGGYYPGFYRMEHGDSAWIGTSSYTQTTMSGIGGDLLGIYGMYYVRSTDRGMTWSMLQNGPRHDYAGPGSLAAANGMVAAGLLGQYDYYTYGPDTSVWISLDKGGSWYLAGHGLPPGQGVYSLVFEGEYLYAGLPTGVWKRHVSELRGLAAVPPEPVTGLGEAGFVPNPFTGAATLRLASELADGELVLADALGRQVERRPGLIGSRVELDRGELPAGVYHCTLRDRGIVIWRGRLIAR